jgi:hypothetical protein
MMDASSALTTEQGSHFARLALEGIHREYPNKLDHVINGPGDLQSPKSLHPAFYGCFDWHSSVHGHWMLVRLLRLLPELPESEEIRAALGRNLMAENIEAETAYLGQPNRLSFERTYGWAWLLKLAEELYAWDDPQGKEWSRNLQGLKEIFVQRYLDFLPKQTYPIRTGTHPNTAFGLAFALDYARTAGISELESLIVKRSLAYYSQDENCPAEWEPGGSDFLSPCLVEADLMRRVLSVGEFRPWLERFLPGLPKGEPENLFTPATVSDRTDPQIVHLDGLNLSRAWCMRNIAADLSPDDPAYRVLANSAELHAQASLPNVASGDYMGEHWLASFAVYMLSIPHA